MTRPLTIPMRWFLPLLGLAALGIAGCHRGAAPGSDAPAAAAPMRLGLSISDLADERIAALRSAAQEAGMELVVGGSTVGVKPQPLQVAELIEAKAAALLLVPSSPDLLRELSQSAAAKSVPLVAIGRGDGRVGAWAGLRSGTLAKEAGQAAGRALKQAGCLKPRVILLETSRWPETARRVDAALKAIEDECGGVEVVVRLTQCESQAETERVLDEGLARTSSIDAILAAEPAPTAGAWKAVARSAFKGRAFVVGVSDDAALVDAARAEGSRLIVVAWTRADLAAKAIAAVLAATKGDAAGSLQEVAATVVGAGG